MKQQIFIIVLFTFILHTAAKIKQDELLLPEKSQKRFQHDMLNTHNLLRKQHGVLPLILDDKISETAQSYAEYLANEDSKLVHSDHKSVLGEN